MSISPSDKVKINKYFRDTPINSLNYGAMCHAIGTKGKISYVEFLEYFTDYVVKEFQREDKLPIKHLSKIIITINSFIEWVNRDEYHVSELTLDKIRSFGDFYDEYLNRTGFDKDLGFTDDYINKVLKTINKLYPHETKNESVAKYINQVEELDDRVKKLEKENSEITSENARLQASCTKKTLETDALNQEAISLRRNAKTQNQEIINLNQTIETLNCKLRIIDEKKQNKKIEAAALRCKQTKIEALIYQKLLLERSNIDEILKYIQEQGLVSNRDEISSLLRNIKSKINIDNSYFTTSPTYKIEEPHILENRQFSINIPKGCKYYDIMLITDLHVAEFNQEVLSGFDVLMDYSVKNNINLILNLGDFYNGLGAVKVDYKGAIKNYKLIAQSISSIPKIDGLYHAILGGNHERNIVKYGYDPISLLESERSDIINLGYMHSTIALQNSCTTLGQFDVHHPYNFDFPIYLDDNGIDITKMNNYLNDIYRNSGRNRNDSYIDILGHTHKAQFNYLASYYYAPPFFDANGRKEACHLRIYFDEDTQIKYMVFMPVSGKDRLVKNNEIIYQKALKKC